VSNPSIHSNCSRLGCFSSRSRLASVPSSTLSRYAMDLREASPRRGAAGSQEAALRASEAVPRGNSRAAAGSGDRRTTQIGGVIAPPQESCIKRRPLTLIEKQPTQTLSTTHDAALSAPPPRFPHEQVSFRPYQASSRAVCAIIPAAAVLPKFSHQKTVELGTDHSRETR